MKVFKFKAAYYRDLAKLLKEVGAVVKNQAYPEYTLVSKVDYKKIEKATKAAFIKEYPYLKFSKKALATSVAMHLLNLGPAVSEAIKPGTILVIDSMIDFRSKKDVIEYKEYYKNETL